MKEDEILNADLIGNPDDTFLLERARYAEGELSLANETIRGLHGKLSAKDEHIKSLKVFGFVFFVMFVIEALLMMFLIMRGD